MVSWISKWAEGIILAVIIVTILEMILPKGNNRKYIKIVMGVYIIFMIVSPIISKVTNNDIAVDVKQYEKYFNSINTGENSNIVASINQQDIENVYLNSIKTDIKTGLEEKGYMVENVQVTAKINMEKQEADIEKITADVKRGENNSDIKKVNKIEIGKTTQETENDISSSEIKEIKDYLSNKYEINSKKIFINNN